MNSEISLKFDDKEFSWKQNESLLRRLEDEGVVKLVFPLHGKPNYDDIQVLVKFVVLANNIFVADEVKRKQLLRNWALNWHDFTWQPIDEVYSYFGTKVEL
jgi:anoctamin-10